MIRVSLRLFSILVISLMVAPVLSAEFNQLTGDRYVPGELLVKFHEPQGMELFSLTNVHMMTGARVVHQYEQIKGLELIRIPQADITEALAYYENQPSVEYVAPNYVVSVIDTMEQDDLWMDEEEFVSIPNDEYFDELWGMHNEGQEDNKGNEGKPDADIDAPLAWDVTEGSQDIIVAVIDTGVDYTHEDLADNMWVNEGEIPDNGIDDDDNGYIDDIHGYDFYNSDGDPMDDHNHGSHCAGTIAAVGNNGIGVIGVAPNVQIMGIKFLSSYGSGSLSGALKSMEYAITNGANVMSNSWGGGDFSKAMFNIIGEANEHGIVFVAAAGNSSANNDKKRHYPSSYEQPNVIGVAATTNKDELASFSSYGEKSVHVAAPGDHILSTTRSNTYSVFRGTSMATPHVAGIAALVLSMDPDMTPEEVKNRIVETSDDVEGLRRRVMAAGRVNANNAVNNIVPLGKIPLDLDWFEVGYDLSTFHPYDSDSKRSWMIHHTGATYIKIHFAEFETESGYDYVTILDAAGNRVDKIDGDAGEFWSYVAKGDTIYVHLTSDDSEEAYGFDIDAYAYSLDLPEDQNDAWRW